jgi:non-ribosomal peptide synthetase component E (peptide arylation enzyme)
MPKPTLYKQEQIDEFIRAGFWDETTPWGLWDQNARNYPQKEAIVDSKTRLTWEQAKIWTDRVALSFIELGVQRDQLLAFQLPNSTSTCCLRVACGKAGALGLGILPSLRHREVEYILKQTQAIGIVIPWHFRGFDYFEMIQEMQPNLPALKFIFVADDNIPGGAISIEVMAKQPIENRYPLDYLERRALSATEVSCLALSTGTTGLPKFVEVPLATRMNLDRELIDVFELTSDDIVITFSPAYGGPNLPAYWVASMTAAKTVMLEHFEAEEALKLIAKERATVICVVPAHLNALLRCPERGKYDLSSVRLWASAGAILPYHIAVEVEDKIGGSVISSYGSTEWGGVCTHSIRAARELRLRTVGKPLAGDEVRLVDENGNEVPQGEIGEIRVRGPCCNSGYYKDPERTREVWTQGDWCRMGDVGRIDPQGNLVIVGRRKDIIIRGGQNIYPTELEDILLTHPKVSNVAVVGMPDDYLGEKACAYVVLKAGQEFSFEEMVSFLKTRKIALYKLPERLELLDSLPLVGGIKVDKKWLEQDIARKLQSQSASKFK